MELVTLTVKDYNSETYGRKVMFLSSMPFLMQIRNMGDRHCLFPPCQGDDKEMKQETENAYEHMKNRRQKIIWNKILEILIQIGGQKLPFRRECDILHSNLEGGSSAL